MQVTDLQTVRIASKMLASLHNNAPLSGDVFLFLNRRRDRIKLLMWDKTGFALYYKQLESGTFELPKGVSGQGLELSWSELATGRS